MRRLGSRDYLPGNAAHRFEESPGGFMMERVTEAALMEHLRAHRFDADAWSVYGDLLQNRGDIRGEMISLQRALMQSPYLERAPDKASLYSRRRRRLIKESKGGPHRVLAFAWGHPVTVKLHGVASFIDRFLEHEDAPFVRAVHLTLTREKEAVAALGRLARLPITQLKLDGDKVEDAKPIFDALDAARIERLHLQSFRLSPDALSSLAERTWTPKLRELRFRGCAFSDESLASFFRDAPIHNVETLCFEPDENIGDYCDPGPRSAQAFARSAAFGSLRTLLMYGTSPDGIFSTLSAPNALPQLKCLALRGDHRAWNLQRLVEQRGLENLERLEIYGFWGPWSEPVLEAINAAQHWQKVQHLVIHGSRMRDEGVEDLAQAPILQGLRHLSLAESWVGDVGAQALAQCPALQDLDVLWLPANQIGYRGAQSLLRSPYLEKLRVLELSEHRIDEADLPRILETCSKGRRCWVGGVETEEPWSRDADSCGRDIQFARASYRKLLINPEDACEPEWI